MPSGPPWPAGRPWSPSPTEPRPGIDPRRGVYPLPRTDARPEAVPDRDVVRVVGLRDVVPALRRRGAAGPGDAGDGPGCAAHDRAVVGAAEVRPAERAHLRPVALPAAQDGAALDGGRRLRARRRQHVRRAL